MQSIRIDDWPSCPVNATGACVLPIRADYMLCTDNAGTAFSSDVTVSPGETIGVDLHKLQQSILRRYIVAHPYGNTVDNSTAQGGWVGDI